MPRSGRIELMFRKLVIENDIVGFFQKINDLGFFSICNIYIDIQVVK